MPQPPYTWLLDDYLTASRLNNELYRINGQPFIGNGIAWHTAKPVYKVCQPGEVGTLPANTWYQMIGYGNQYGVIADTAVYWGARADSGTQGIYGGNFISRGGGAPGANGGLALFMSNASFTAGSAGNVHSGVGVYTSSTPQSSGAIQPTVGLVTASHHLDIIDIGANSFSGFAEVSVSGLYSGGTTTDGSGIANRQHSFWASVYPAYGNTVGTLPAPVSSWSGTTPSLTAALMNGNTGLAGAMNLLNMPPLLRAQATSASLLPNNTTKIINLPAGTWDTYNAFTPGSSAEYTVPLTGLYLAYGVINFDSSVLGSNQCQAGISVNGTTYYGPIVQGNGTQACGASKVQIFSLNAGDTVSLMGEQGSGGSASTSTNAPSLLVLLYLGQLGAPGTLPSVPDVTYLWQAGTPASAMPGLMNAHFANDLLFLTQRPYLMAYQTSAQTGIAMNTPTTLVCQSLTGEVHGDAGDNYSGWTSGTSNKYTAQRAGWYLAVQESFLASPTLTSTPQVAAGFAVNPDGAASPDYYQKQCMRTGGTTGGGAAAVGLYYLSVGDTIAPQVWSINSSSTTIATTAGGSHFELVWLSD